jgi:WD40 repeat protein
LEGLVQAPENAGKGTAKVALSFDAWKPGAVQAATVEVPVQVIEAVESAQLKATLKGFEDSIWRVAWAPDGKALATLSTVNGEVKLWDVAQRKERKTLRTDLGASYSLAFTPDGKMLIVGHIKLDDKTERTGGIALWDVATGERKGLLQHSPPRGVGSILISGDGKTIAASETWKEGDKGEYRRGVTLWDIATGKPQVSEPTDNMSTMAFAPEGKVLAQAVYTLKDNRLDEVEVRRRDLTTGKDLAALPYTVSKNPINSLAFSSDGKTLAGADYEGNIVVWDTASAKVRTTMKQEDRRRISSLAFSPDGKTLAAAVADRPGRDHEPGLIELWDAATGERRLVLTGHTNAVLSVAFSPDGKLLASGSSDRTVRLWDITELPATGEESSGQ